VIKTHHTVKPIMAGQTVITKILGVLGHKLCVVAGMAAKALLRRNRKVILSGMTGGTVHRDSIITDLVP
jgi:hypothetical protein